MDWITTNELVASTPLWASIVGQVLIVGGALLFTTAAVGLVRLPDMYTRASAIATAAGFGVALVASGSFFFVIGVDTAIKIALAVVLQLVTSAVGSMTLARAAYLTGSAVYSPTHTDQLAESIRDEPGWQHIEPLWRPEGQGVNPDRIVGAGDDSTGLGDPLGPRGHPPT
ncbi:MAG: monovalent cation/H(+) antiporter subunit G [Mobilicoccus sp.]|nr:monovalent cation/H(+) antiporter subunit G [Mobilicoccus sp.]